MYFNLDIRHIIFYKNGELAQMVERSLSMREVVGSIPTFSNNFISNFYKILIKPNNNI